jgi:hypothetical protein
VVLLALPVVLSITLLPLMAPLHPQAAVVLAHRFMESTITIPEPLRFRAQGKKSLLNKLSVGG